MGAFGIPIALASLIWLGRCLQSVKGRGSRFHGGEDSTHARPQNRPTCIKKIIANICTLRGRRHDRRDYTFLAAKVKTNTSFQSSTSEQDLSTTFRLSITMCFHTARFNSVRPVKPPHLKSPCGKAARESHSNAEASYCVIIQDYRTITELKYIENGYGKANNMACAAGDIRRVLLGAEENNGTAGKAWCEKGYWARENKLTK